MFGLNMHVQFAIHQQQLLKNSNKPNNNSQGSQFFMKRLKWEGGEIQLILSPDQTHEYIIIVALVYI